MYYHCKLVTVVKKGDEDIEEIQIHLSKIDQSKHNNIYDDGYQLGTITLYLHTHMTWAATRVL